jgi:hypothetical protein
MRVKVIRKHPSEWEIREFPTFAKGTEITAMSEQCDSHFLHWHECVIDGYETFVPQSFVCDGKLNRDYNPTELPVEVGDVLEVREIVNAWLIVENAEGVVGWIPAENVVSTI